MKEKNLLTLIPALASIMALGLGTYFGIEDTSELENILVGIGTGIVTIVGLVGAFISHTKKQK